MNDRVNDKIEQVWTSEWVTSEGFSPSCGVERDREDEKEYNGAPGGHVCHPRPVVRDEGQLEDEEALVSSY